MKGRHLIAHIYEYILFEKYEKNENNSAFNIKLFVSLIK